MKNTDELQKKYLEAWKQYRKTHSQEDYKAMRAAWIEYKSEFDKSLR